MDRPQGDETGAPQGGEVGARMSERMAEGEGRSQAGRRRSRGQSSAEQERRKSRASTPGSSRGRINSALRLDATLNGDNKGPELEEALSVLDPQLRECMLTLARAGDQNVVSDFWDLASQDLIGLEQDEKKLVFRVAEIELCHHNRALAPHFVVDADGHAHLWYGGSGLQVLIPIDLEEHHVKAYIRKSVNKWLTKTLQFSKRVFRPREDDFDESETSSDESESGESDLDCPTSGSESDDEPEPGDEPEQEPAARHKRGNGFAKTASKPFLDRVCSFSVNPRVTALSMQMNSSPQLLLQSLVSSTAAKEGSIPSSASASSSSSSSSTAAPLTSILTRDDRSSMEDLGFSDLDMEDLQPDESRIRLVVHRKTIGTSGKVSKSEVQVPVETSRFAPFAEVMLLSRYSVSLHGEVWKSMERIRSRVVRGLSSPTLANGLWSSRHASFDRAKISWIWKPRSCQLPSEEQQCDSGNCSGDCNSCSRLTLSVATRQQTTKQGFVSKRGQRHSVSDVIDLEKAFSFRRFFADRVPSTQGGAFHVKALRRLLQINCRFEVAQIDVLFNMRRSTFVQDNGERVAVLEPPEFDALCDMLEEMVVSNAPSSDEDVVKKLSQEDLRVVRGLFPHCCRVQVRKLAGGFSGAIVLQTTSYDVEGRAEDSTVVKLDSMELILEEEHRHKMVLQYLGDHAPLVLGKCFLGTDQSQRAGIKISLAGDQSIFRGTTSSQEDSHLITLKELYFFEQQQISFRHQEMLPKLKTINAQKLQQQERAAIFLSDIQSTASSAIEVDVEVVEDAIPARELQSSMVRKTKVIATTSPNIGAIHSVHNVLLEVFGEVFEKCTVQSSVNMGRLRGHVGRDLFDLAGTLRAHALHPSKAAFIGESVWDAQLLLESCLLSRVLGNAPANEEANGSVGVFFDFLLKLQAFIDSAPAVSGDHVPATVDDQNQDDAFISYYKGVAHGDLNAGNIVIDSKSIPWVIDFSHSGAHHVLMDLVKMMSCVLFEYLDISSQPKLEAAVRMIDVLSSSYGTLHCAIPGDLDRFVLKPLLDSVKRDSKNIVKEDVARLELAWQSCKTLRGYCAKYARDAIDIRQYHAGMVYFSVRAMHYKDTSKFQHQLALCSVVLHGHRLMLSKRQAKVNRFLLRDAGDGDTELIAPPAQAIGSSMTPINEGGAVIPSPISSKGSRIRKEVHMRSYLNRIAVKCGHHIDPLSREMFAVTDSVDLDVQFTHTGLPRRKTQDPKVLALESSVLVTGKQRKRPAPLQLGSSCTSFTINERSSRFFEIVQKMLGVDLLSERKVAICGASTSGKTVVLKKLVTHALTEQDFFIPVYIELEDLCKFLRKSVESSQPPPPHGATSFEGSSFASSLRGIDNSATSASSLCSGGASGPEDLPNTQTPSSSSKRKQTYIEFLRGASGNSSESNTSTPSMGGFFSEVSDNSWSGSVRSRPVSTVNRAANFFTGSSPANRNIKLQQRDIIRMHQHELLFSPTAAGSRQARSAASTVLFSPKAGLKKRNPSIRSNTKSPSHGTKGSASIAMQTHSPSSTRGTRRFQRKQVIQQLKQSTQAANVELELDLLELFWASRFGEQSPMFLILLKALRSDKLLLFLDGLDDMREDTKQDLLVWLDTKPNLRVFVTSRRERDLRSQVERFAVVRVRALTSVHIHQMVRSYVNRIAVKEQLDPDHAQNLEQFLREEMQKTMFREVVSGSPVMVNLLIFALSKHWRSSMGSSPTAPLAGGLHRLLQSEARPSAPPSVQDEPGNEEPSTEAEAALVTDADATSGEDIEWGLPQIMQFAVLHLIQSVSKAVSKAADKSMKLCRSERGLELFECMAFALHLRRQTEMPLGGLLMEGLELLVERGFPAEEEIANAVSYLCRSNSLNLLSFNSQDGAKPWLDRSCKFSIHVLQEYLAASHLSKRIMSIALASDKGDQDGLARFLVILNKTSRDRYDASTNNDATLFSELPALDFLDEGGEILEEDEDEVEESEEESKVESEDDGLEGLAAEDRAQGVKDDDESVHYLTDESSVSSDSDDEEIEGEIDDWEDTADDEGSIVSLSAVHVGRFKLLNDPHWQSVMYLVLKLTLPRDITGTVCVKLFATMLRLTGDSSFGTQVRKFMRFVVRAGDGNLLKQLCVLFSKEPFDEMELVRKALSPSESDQSTALMLAARRGHSKILKALIESLHKLHGQQATESMINMHSAHGDSALSVAAEHGHVECVRVLLHHRASLDSDNDPLYLAAFGGHTQVVQLLLDHGADPNASLNGTSCLFNAAHDGNEELCSVLLRHGASKTQANPSGLTPVDVAQREEHFHLVPLLL